MPGDRAFAVVWFSALVLSIAAVIFLLYLSALKSPAPESVKYRTQVDLVIGSSFAHYLLPPVDELPSLLPDGRETEVLWRSAISMKETMILLSWAVQYGTGDVIVEVNALTLDTAHGLDRFGDPRLKALMPMQQALATEITLSLWRLLGLGQWTAKWGRSDNIAMPINIIEEDSLSYVVQDFEYHAELREHLKVLRNAGRKLIFYWSPAPERGAGRNVSEWTKARAHLVEFCTRYATPCWLPEAPWQDHLFLDVWGHLAPEGRKQFAREFQEWAGRTL